MNRYFTPDEVARIMGVSRSTIYSQISRGNLKAYRFGRSRRITEKQIQDCLDSKYERPIVVTGPNAAL